MFLKSVDYFYFLWIFLNFFEFFWIFLNFFEFFWIFFNFFEFFWFFWTFLNFLYFCEFFWKVLNFLNFFWIVFEKCWLFWFFFNFFEIFFEFFFNCFWKVLICWFVSGFLYLTLLLQLCGMAYSPPKPKHCFAVRLLVILLQATVESRRLMRTSFPFYTTSHMHCHWQPNCWP